MIDIQVKGVEKLLARIQKAKSEKAVFRIATREAAKIIADQVRQDLPVKTGLLRSGVTVRSLNSRKKIGAKVIVGQPGTETYRGWFVEVGTKQRFTRRGANRGRVVGAFYVRRATQRVAAQASDTMREIIKKGIFIDQ